MFIPLSQPTHALIEALFDGPRAARVRRTLGWSVGLGVPLVKHTPSGLERIRFAVIKLVAEHPDAFEQTLTDAAALAREDWRDLLVAAGFAEDPEAHRAWFARTTNVSD